MSARPAIYWIVCSALAAIAARAADPTTAGTKDWMPAPEDVSTLVAVPEPGRALLLFAGMMAMAFTYRRVWLNWKRRG